MIMKQSQYTDCALLHRFLLIPHDINFLCCVGSKDLSRRPGYFDERSKCLQNFSELFGYLPLQGTNSLATLV